MKLPNSIAQNIALPHLLRLRSFAQRKLENLQWPPVRVILSISTTPGRTIRPQQPNQATFEKMNKHRILGLRHELESLAIDYWHEVDVNDGRRAADYYTPDAVFQTSVRAYQGIEEIRAFYRRRQSRSARVSVHVMSNFRIDPQSEIRVLSSYVISLYAADGTPVLPSKPAIVLGFADEALVQQPDGGWLCESRRIRTMFRGDTPSHG
jgi:hypothetical protein